ncbi:ABC transporter substrate-binding protein [Paenibacillus sp. IITD108]|uniref:ABC transporter substrate-binding protein n=1 Tax=Paenibacillus sp. IITD108 TaxID=3116649 RepID=UPI002F3E7C93
MKKNAKLTLVLVFALIMTLVSACGDRGGNEGNSPSPTSAATNTAEQPSQDEVYPENGLSKTEQVSLKIGIDENGYGRAWLDYAIDNFTKKYPNVKFEINASPAIYDMIKTKIAANSDTDMFDLFPGKIDSNSVKLIDAGKYEPIDELWERDVPDVPGLKLKDALLDGVYDNNPRYKGKSYNVPVGGYTTGWFFDKKLFEENGWNMNPQTWDEFLQLMETIKAKGVTPIVYAGVYPEYFHTFGFGPKQFEIAEINGTLDKLLTDFRSMTLPKYSSAENIAAWEKMAEIGKKGYVANGVAAINHTQSQMMVLQGKAALVPTGDWVGNEMKDATPEGFEWGFMTIPVGNDPNQTKWIMSDYTSGGYVVWSGKPDLNKKWAKEFLLSLATLDQQTYMVENAGIFPVRKDFADDAARMEKVQNAPKAVMEYLSKNKVRSESMRIDVVIDHPAVNNATKVIQEAANDLITGKKEIAPVMAKADEVLKEAIDSVSK